MSSIFNSSAGQWNSIRAVSISSSKPSSFLKVALKILETDLYFFTKLYSNILLTKHPGYGQTPHIRPSI